MHPFGFDYGDGNPLHVLNGSGSFVSASTVVTVPTTISQTSGCFLAAYNATTGSFTSSSVVLGQGARVYNDANLSIPNGSGTFLTFNSERYDTDGIHDTSTNTGSLVCRTAGIYHIIGNIAWQQLNSSYQGRRLFRIKLNGTTDIASVESNGVAVGAGTEGVECQQNISTIYPLNVGDYLDLWVYQTSSISININAAANFSPEFMMQRIG